MTGSTGVVNSFTSCIREERSEPQIGFCYNSQQNFVNTKDCCGGENSTHLCFESENFGNSCLRVREVVETSKEYCYDNCGNILKCFKPIVNGTQHEKLVLLKHTKGSVDKILGIIFLHSLLFYSILNCWFEKRKALVSFISISRPLPFSQAAVLHTVDT